MHTSTPFVPSGFKLAVLTGALLLAPFRLSAQFLPTPPGTYDFNNPANWTGGVVNGQFSGDLDGIFTTTNANLTLGNLSWNHTGAGGASPSLRADGTGDRTLTFTGGNITLNTAGGFLTAMLGNGSAGSRLLTDFSGTTTIDTISGSTVFSLQNDATFSGAVTKTGAGRIDTFGNVSVTGSLVLNGGTLNVGGGNLNVTGGMTVNSGANLSLFSNGSLSGNLTVSSGGTISFSHSGDQTYSGVITGAGTIYKLGTGVLTLAENDVMTGGHTGLTFVQQGTLRITGAYAQLGSSGVSMSMGTVLDVQNNLIVGSLSGQGEVTLASGRTLNIGGGTYGGLISGAGSLSSGGNLTLTGNNTYTGGTNLWGGLVTVGYDNALGTGTVQFSGGGLAASGNRTITNAFIIGGAATIGGSGNLTMTGNLTLDTNKTINVTSTGTTNFSGVFDGTGALSKTGTGVLTLSGTNTYSGGTTIVAGAIEFSSADNFGTGSVYLNGGGLRWASGTTTDLTSRLTTTLGGSGGTFDTNGNNVSLGTSFTAIGGITKNGAGTLTLTGNSTNTGATVVNGGTLALGAVNALSATTNLTVNSSGTLAVNQNQTVGTLAGSGSVAIAGATTLAVSGTAMPLFSGTISGAGGLAKAGTGTLTLTGNNTYAGGTALNEGTLTVGTDTALGTGTIQFNGGTLNASGTRTLANPYTVSGTAKFQGTLTLTGDTTLSAPSTFQANGTTTLSGNLSGTGSLTKTGAMVTLSGTNTYSGGTTINSGILRFANAAALPGTGNVSLAAGATLLLNVGGSGEFFDADVAGLVGRSTFAANSSLALDTTNAGGSFNLNTGLTGNLGLTKQGTGTLTLSGATNYTGMTRVTAGTLVTSSVNQFANSSGMTVLGSGTTLNLQHDQTLQGLSLSAGVITGGGALVLAPPSGTTVFNVSGTLSHTGGTTVTAGILAGTGTITGDVLSQAGAVIFGGTSVSGSRNAPGNLTLGNLDMDAGSVLRVAVSDASGPAGATATFGVGWSLLTLTGSLDFIETTSDPFILQLHSVKAATAGMPIQGAPFAALNFDPGAPASFLVATAAGGITGFDAGAWTVDTTAFQNAFTGSWFMSQAGNNLYLNYSTAAIPEPSTWTALAGLAALGLAGWRRRRARA